MRLHEGDGSAISGDLRARKKAATRQALIRAAGELFAAKGFAATSVDDIAAAADVSRSTFFRYFGSKEAVLFVEQDDAGNAFTEHLVARPADESPVDAFEEALISALSATGGDERREDARAREKLFADEPALRARFLEERERWLHEVAAAFARREGRSEPDGDDLLVATVCFGVVDQVGRFWREAATEPPAVQVIRERFEALRRLVAG